MATISNAMAAAGIQPKHWEIGVLPIVCTQAVASDAASDQDYKLFAVAKGMTIVKAMLQIDTAIESADTTNTMIHMGLASGGGQLVSSGQVSYTYPQYFGAACTLPYTCTADAYVYLTLGVAATAAANVVCTVYACPTHQMT